MTSKSSPSRCYASITISPGLAEAAQAWIYQVPAFNSLTAAVPWRKLARESAPEFIELASSVHPLLHQGSRSVLLDARALLRSDLAVSKFFINVLASCFGEPTATDQRDRLIAWEVAPRTNLSPGHRPTITENHEAAAPHTDSSYRPYPERYVALFVVRPAADGGGQSEIVDGRALINQLLECSEGRECARLLQTIKFPFRVPDSFVHPENRAIGEVVFAPVLATEPLIRFRYDSIIEGLEVHPQVDSKEARWAIDYLRGAIASAIDPVLALKAGDLLLTNNHEILHGRTAFGSRNRLLIRVRIQ